MNITHTLKSQHYSLYLLCLFLMMWCNLLGIKVLDSNIVEVSIVSKQLQGKPLGSLFPVSVF